MFTYYVIEYIWQQGGCSQRCSCEEGCTKSSIMILKVMALAWPVNAYKDLTLRLKTKAQMSGQHKYSKGGHASSDLFSW